MHEKQVPKKPLIFYYAIVLLFILFLNAIVFPNILKKPVNQVDYSEFLNQVEAGQVTTVEVQDSKIVFVVKDVNQGEVIYMTGKMEDLGLVNRLHDADVQFSQIVPKENSPLVNFIFTWILPMVLFIGLGQLFATQLQKKMGGGANAMSFGKSNAKIYVEAQTGKTFADVAGQDEAKEALKEIVDFLHNPA